MKKCPVEIGDTFYRYTDKINIPDRLEVIDIMEYGDRILVRARYMYRAIGPVFERTFDAKIFDDPNWVVEKRKERTA